MKKCILTQCELLTQINAGSITLTKDGEKQLVFSVLCHDDGYETLYAFDSMADRIVNMVAASKKAVVFFNVVTSNEKVKKEKDGKPVFREYAKITDIEYSDGIAHVGNEQEIVLERVKHENKGNVA